MDTSDYSLSLNTIRLKNVIREQRASDTLPVSTIQPPFPPCEEVGLDGHFLKDHSEAATTTNFSSLAKGKNNLPFPSPHCPVNLEPTFEPILDEHGKPVDLNTWFTYNDLFPYMWEHWVNWKQEWSEWGSNIMPWCRPHPFHNQQLDLSSFSNYSAPKWFALLFWKVLFPHRWRKGIALKRDDEIIVLPFKIRGSGAYHYDTIEKFKRLHASLNPKMSLIHIRLSPQTGLFNNIFEAILGMEVAWEKLHKLLKRGLYKTRKGKRGEELHFEYIKVIEPHASGFPHYHILIFGYPYIIDKSELDTAWARYGMGTSAGIWIQSVNRQGFRTKSGNEVDAAVGYTVKYVTKGFNHPLWIPILFLLNVQSYTASKGISGILRGDKTVAPGWIYVLCDNYQLLLKMVSDPSYSYVFKTSDNPLETSGIGG